LKTKLDKLSEEDLVAFLRVLWRVRREAVSRDVRALPGASSPAMTLRFFTRSGIVVHAAVTTFSPHQHDDPVACRRGRRSSRRVLGRRGHAGKAIRHVMPVPRFSLRQRESRCP